MWMLEHTKLRELGRVNVLEMQSSEFIEQARTDVDNYYIIPQTATL